MKDCRISLKNGPGFPEQTIISPPETSLLTPRLQELKLTEPFLEVFASFLNPDLWKKLEEYYHMQNKKCKMWNLIFLILISKNIAYHSGPWWRKYKCKNVFLRVAPSELKKSFRKLGKGLLFLYRQRRKKPTT